MSTNTGEEIFSEFLFWCGRWYRNLPFKYESVFYQFNKTVKRKSNTGDYQAGGEKSNTLLNKQQHCSYASLKADIKAPYSKCLMLQQEKIRKCLYGYFLFIFCSTSTMQKDYKEERYSSGKFRMKKKSHDGHGRGLYPASVMSNTAYC